jgi:tetratricopeptide (TPR) repeat protein
MEAFNAKRYEEAASGFEAVTRSDPKNFEAQFNLGKSYEALKKSDDAVRAYKAAIALKPEHGEANLNAGSIEHGRKNYQAAEPFLEQAAKTDYKSTRTLMALADNQRELKMYDRAIVQYGKVIGFEPNNAEAYYGLGLTYIGLKNKIGARQQLQKLEPLNKELAKKLSDAIGG